MRTEVNELRTETEALKLTMEGLKYRVRDLERQNGYNGADPDADEQKRRKDRR